ncbi:cellulase family glycosylhydrolase [Paenibacillus radicis (ex Xue et al. 2023)]|uniref:Cellulase family glycosylhydrolase n=1 Tax=Paenibacillus radicis (ex Xue et al. 2023) TaxID=2972489 RepID=A0ABT1YBL3_9BACL|nr:cellulase family glycosylhydrolase [Paenibacillus radicis (ex Xue et al. 2023)]MCR8630579.1 cellulase family glycosylhydrolase [Paenibacillus radicis (ex Xue et al. 2023)]
MRKMAFKPLALLALSGMMLMPLSTAGYAETPEPSPYVKNIDVNSFKAMNPANAVRDMAPGWNLGNTLDATGGEGSWNNPPVEESTFDDVVKIGFKSVRIPITWDAYIGSGPDYPIDPAWLNRVETVVDWALKRDLYVMINVHHDNYMWATQMAVDPTTGMFTDNFNNNMDKLEKVWAQISSRFRFKSEKLMFEVLNEPDRGEFQGNNLTPDDPDNPGRRNHLTPEELNVMNFRMVKTMRNSGGYNNKRLLVIGAEGDNSEMAVDHLVIPQDRYIIATFHYYSPWDFVSNWWGRTTWGTDDDKKEMDKAFRPVYDKFVRNGVPVIMGEFGTVGQVYEHSKQYYYDYMMQLSYKYGFAPIYWDNGNDNLDRKSHTWRFEQAVKTIVSGAKGIRNSFIFPGEAYFADDKPLEDYTAKLELNGNTVEGIYTGTSNLISGTDYTFDQQKSEITFKKSMLSQLIKSKKLGVNAELKFHFSGGVEQTMPLIQYAQPSFSKTDATAIGAAEDVKFPIEFNGTALATVKAVTSTGAPVKEEWAKGYLRYNDDFATEGNDLILKSGFLENLKPGTETKVTFEFFPKGVNQEVTLKMEEGPKHPQFTSSLVIKPKEVSVGEPVEIIGKIKSVDGASISSAVVNIEIHLNGQKIDQKVFDGQVIEENGSLSVRYIYTPTVSGKYIVKFALFTKNWKEGIFWNDNAGSILAK